MVLRCAQTIQFLENTDRTFAAQVQAHRSYRLSLLHGEEGVTRDIQIVGNYLFRVIGVG